MTSCTQRLEGKQLQMIDLNVRALVELTGRLLPALQARGGAVVNIASTAAFQPTPYMATYGASKAFVLHWTLALSEDLRESKVRTLAVCPGPTRTNFFHAAGFASPPMQGGINGALDMSADQVAERALVALARGQTLLVTGWKNKLIAFVGSKTPKVWRPVLEDGSCAACVWSNSAAPRQEGGRNECADSPLERPRRWWIWRICVRGSSGMMMIYWWSISRVGWSVIRQKMVRCQPVWAVRELTGADKPTGRTLDRETSGLVVFANARQWRASTRWRSRTG